MSRPFPACEVEQRLTGNIVAAKLIGYMWRDEAPEVRSWYDALAEEKKLEHAIKHPGPSSDRKSVV